jgi:O-antigen ligase
MAQVTTRSIKFGQAVSTVPSFDKRAIIPISVVVYCSIVSPFLVFLNSSDPLGALPTVQEARQENMIFWPAVTAISIVLALRNRSRLARLPPHIVWLFAYLAFAGASVLWAFDPRVSFTKFCVEAMVITSIVLPAMLVDRNTDLMRGVFLAFAAASILNLIVAVNEPPKVWEGVAFYQGYLSDKNSLGECASIAFVLALYETLHSGARRVLGVLVAVISASLVFLSNSKTALGLAVLSPLLAAPLVLVGRRMRLSPAIILLPVVFLYVLLYNTNVFNHVSYVLYGNYTFSARTLIWDFVRHEIERRPLFGWGYQSFWQLGPGGPSVTDGWGWLKMMPHAHNGYYDTMLQIGYVGFAFLLIFVFATLHAARGLVDRDPVRAWLVLSLALYVIITNFFESTWLRGDVPAWVVFVIAAAEIGRYRHRPGVPSQQLADRAAARSRAIRIVPEFRPHRN